MIKIERDFDKLAIAHFNKLKDVLLSRIDNGQNYISKTQSTPLTDKHKRWLKFLLKEIIISKPERLKRINKIFENIFPSTDYRKIFDYKWFTNKDRKGYDAYELAKILNIRTCCYCNRNFTTTVISSKDKISRPQFDHFFYKKKYSLMALSFYNLIPSCSICNTTLKGEKDYGILHPYIDDVINDFEFKAIPQNITTLLNINDDFKIEYKELDATNLLNSKLKESIELFKLREIYASNGNEIKDLFLIRYKYSKKYLEVLEKMTKGKFTEEELFRLAFGTEINSINFESRPFSKLKKDILKELGIIK
ncbi:hypothetical protein [Flavobacterium branchiophilum]|uniref:HNH endonuclease n=1 Tax=Flavobacterium branchiophilum TaxID=55197 RepID=A0A2H3KA42_9FLAO|nr:hypothetical protein [Flavobacterium branchiophilum]PDS23296.1 hypothetical protein B0A77_11210 [Flavobacterium branchiophilum]